MSAERDLKITIKADNQTKDGAAEAVADLKRVDKAASDGVARRKEGIRELVDAERKARLEAAAGYESFSKSAVAAHGAIAAAAAVGNTLLGKAVELAQAYAKALEDASKKSRQSTTDATEQRDKYRNLGTVMGRPADNKFVLENAAFNKAAAMKTDEGLAFRDAFQGAGAQFAGKSMSEAEFVQYERQMAQLTAARGLDAKVGGELGGSILGMQDFSKHGEQASEKALGLTNAALAVLGRGRGENSVLAGQLTRFASASVAEDATKGAIQDPVDAAAMISVMAEKSPEQAAELSQMALRGLRDFNNPLIKAAGINAQTTPIEAFKKLAPIVNAEAKKKNVKPEDVLREAFHDVGTAQAIGVGINKGVEGGVFQDRLDYAKQFAGEKPAMDAIEQFQNDEVGQSRIADAAAKEAELKKGLKNSRLDIVRKQAFAKLVNEGRIDTTQTNFQDYLKGAVPFGMLKSDSQTRIDDEVENIVAEREKKAGLPGGRYGGLRGKRIYRRSFDRVEDADAWMNQRLDDVERGGVNALTGNRRSDGPIPTEGVDKVVASIDKQTRMMERDMGGAPPALPAEPPPPMRRQ